MNKTLEELMDLAGSRFIMLSHQSVIGFPLEWRAWATGSEGRDDFFESGNTRLEAMEKLLKKLV